jgi:hypothetical protein
LASIDYLNPKLPPALVCVEMPILEATDAALEGYGRLIDHPNHCRIEIVRWPAQGTRPVDEDTGDQGGTTEGVFVSEWRGDILYGRNDAVDGHYILAYACDPVLASSDHGSPPQRMMARSAFSTGRVRFTRAFRWILRANSAACWGRGLFKDFT